MHIELHILQNFAPSCLNRDDTNSPKDCTFGGVRRARLSSQSLKRAIRQSDVFKGLVEGEIGTRTKLLGEQIVSQLAQQGRDRETAERVTNFALSGAGYKMDGGKSAVLLFLSPGEIARYAEVIATHWDALLPLASAEEEPKEATAKKPGKADKKEKGPTLPAPVAKALKALGSDQTEAADIALFGRMIAESTNMNIVAACQVAHAISTHEVRPESDFFTAIDDLQPSGETGAGMMGTVEFNSACYYRYASVDLGTLSRTLFDKPELARKVALAFVHAAIVARPTAKQASMAAHNPPSFVMVRVRKSGAPCSLTNAFVQPVRLGRDGDLAKASIDALTDYDARLNQMYGTEEVLFSKSVSTYDQPGSGSVAALLKAVAEAVA